MKKWVTRILIGLTVLGLFGCAKKPQDKVTGNGPGKENLGTKVSFTSQDYDQGNRAYCLSREMMKTEKGFYHYNYFEGSLSYYDLSSGKDMYLCNKPECRHDGNQFCVATNDSYQILDCCLYDNRILELGVEETETQYLLKLLAIAPDGSMLDDVATVYTVAKTGNTLRFTGHVFAHRNKVLLTLTSYVPKMHESTNKFGTAILDLNSGKATFFDEEPLSKENQTPTKITAFGDYFYYCKKEGKKVVLHRYSLNTGVDEICKLQSTFKGYYVVLDEDTIVYQKSNGSGSHLCTYRCSTGESVEEVTLKKTVSEYSYGEVVGEKVKGYVATELRTDGTYFYLPEDQCTYPYQAEDGEEVRIAQALIHVMNAEFEEIATVDMEDFVPEIHAELGEWMVECYNISLRYLGEDIYWCLIPRNNSNRDCCVYRCKRSDFLAGNPEFTFVYQYRED